MPSWDVVRQRFVEIVFRARNVDEVARQIPADRATVYRIIASENHKVSHSVREGIERIVESPPDRNPPK